MRVILDTNILVSALVFKSEVANKVVKIAVKEHIVLFSKSTFNELKDTMLKPKFVKHIELKYVNSFLQKLAQIGLFNEPEIKITDCRDPKDNIFLELAIAGKAGCIVTGDNDLLILNPYRSISIITPSRVS